MPIALVHVVHMQMFPSLLTTIALEVLAESFSIHNLVVHDPKEEVQPTCSCVDLP